MPPNEFQVNQVNVGNIELTCSMGRYCFHWKSKGLLETVIYRAYLHADNSGHHVDVKLSVFPGHSQEDCRNG